MDKNKKLIELKNLIEAAEISLQQARKIMLDLVGSEEEKMLAGEVKKSSHVLSTNEGQVIEGVFDGQNMIGPDGKKYSVPANYASKSKLVEGDSLKLTITADGSFVYKQINLLERDRIIGQLAIDETTNEYRVLANNKSYKVLTASITYFKGEAGDRVTILAPQGRESTWAAVENIFKAGETLPEQAAADSHEEQSDDKSEEFLTADKETVPVRQTVPSQSGKPEDIFEATEKTDTADVKQVDIESLNPEETAHGLINQKDNQPKADNLSGQDSQGLEDI
ncbi:hypothetical protein AUK13_02955 [Candidatus Kuenenbacteria bacterium CG2_30_39_24]|uniref:50S ribosomal protein L7/L12 n=1 Tax=Candidatus Kuenenbacteria bacterium CG2_30_39_24 TaxID=1805236 RepID=A0A1J5F4W2_9BACT|nr:MAG: hypothetical protein AUK13_02955 [Candidatus Kuenenbacteria bacterium CG2_30_39_24]